MESKLIFDIGCHTLDSTYKFLEEGNTVIAVDADINKLFQISSKYYDYIKFKKLILINKAVTDKNDEIINFYIQPNWNVWNSIYKNIAERHDISIKTTVITTTLNNLIDNFGIPEYCKIDIEGADILALESLNDKLPKFISCESECLGINDNPEPLKVLNKLHELGYNKFYLEKQPSNIVYTDIREWESYEDFKNKLLQTRQNHKFKYFYDFWYDIFATYEV